MAEDQVVSQNVASILHNKGDRAKTSGEILTSEGWIPLEHNMPTGLERHCMALVDSSNVIVTAGLNNKNFYVTKTSFYNFETKDWSDGPGLRYARGGHACGMVKKDKDSQEVNN